MSDQTSTRISDMMGNVTPTGGLATPELTLSWAVAARALPPGEEEAGTAGLT